MLSIVYSSHATSAFQAEDLTHLLLQSRRTNEEEDLTGMLLYRSGYFLQVLEGPDETVRARMTKIEGDLRHTDVRILIEENIQDRLFPEWTMGYDQLQSAPPEQVPGFRTAFDDIEQGQTSSTTLHAVRALIAWYKQRSY